MVGAAGAKNSPVRYVINASDWSQIWRRAAV